MDFSLNPEKKFRSVLMIEERIQILRRAARISSRENNEKVWCVIAGNDRLLDDIAYNAITAKDRTKILFRETITLEEKRTLKKYDCIMLKGEELKIREIANYSNERGGASVQFTSELLKDKPNLLILIGLEEQVIRFTGDCNRANISIEYLLEDHTTGFIKTEIKSGFKIPSFLKNTFTPILDVSDVVLTTLLVSVENDGDLAKAKELSKDTRLFGIDLKNTIKDKTDEDDNDSNKEEESEAEEQS